MSSHIRLWERRTVDGRSVEIMITTFSRDPRPSFDVYVDDELLTEESIDDPPTDDKVRELIAQHEGNSDDG